MPSINFKVIVGGTYKVGMSNETKSRFQGAPILHGRIRAETERNVTITSFLMSDFPITNAQFEKIFPSHARSSAALDDDHPVVDVTLYEALLFCQKSGVVFLQ